MLLYLLSKYCWCQCAAFIHKILSFPFFSSYFISTIITWTGLYRTLRSAFNSLGLDHTKDNTLLREKRMLISVYKVYLFLRVCNFVSLYDNKSSKASLVLPLCRRMLSTFQLWRFSLTFSSFYSLFFDVIIFVIYSIDITRTT